MAIFYMINDFIKPTVYLYVIFKKSYIEKKIILSCNQRMSLKSYLLALSDRPSSKLLTHFIFFPHPEEEEEEEKNKNKTS